MDIDVSGDIPDDIGVIEILLDLNPLVAVVDVIEAITARTAPLPVLSAVDVDDFADKASIYINGEGRVEEVCPDPPRSCMIRTSCSTLSACFRLK